MRQNPHVRICGGPGSATTLVYPTDHPRAAPDSDRAPSTRPPRPPSTPSGRSPAAGWLSTKKLRYTTVLFDQHEVLGSGRTDWTNQSTAVRQLVQ